MSFLFELGLFLGRVSLSLLAYALFGPTGAYVYRVQITTCIKIEWFLLDELEPLGLRLSDLRLSAQ